MISDVDVLFAKKFLDYISDIKKHVKNTQGKIIRRLKTVVKNAQQQGYRVNPDYANIKSFEDDKDIVYLTFDELDQLEAQTFDNKRIEIARDWFIISCFTAQRISDVQRLHAGLIKKIKGHNYFCFRQYKTSNYVEIPIHYKVEEVMKKYKGFPPLFTTNLDSNRSMLSKLIKEACMLSKINEKIDGQLNGKKGIFPKYKFISNQSGRQFFASNFYGVDGWSLPVVMAITGHKTEKSFMHYINQQDTSHSRTAAALFNSDKKSNQNLKAKETPHLRIVKKQA
jgi:integrase